MKNSLKRVSQNLFLIISIFIFQGCATIGSEFRFEGPKSISVGNTTKSEILSDYGKPFRVGYENGDEKWTYGYYKYSLFSDAETKDLVLIFNNQGIVTHYTYSSSNPSEIKKASRK